MATFTQGSTRVTLLQTDLNSQNNGSIVLDSRRTRPLWFDGRFLSAKDLEREQDYFLQRQADLGQAAGFGVLHGLQVNQPPSTGGVSNAETIVIHAGNGITPAGELVMIPGDLTIQLSDLAEEENLGLQFGISTLPQQPARTRTGVYVIALRPVEFTANPIASYPTSIQGSRTTHDGDIVEATAVSLVPYPNPVPSDPTQQQSALARQTFLSGNPGRLSDSLLPLAMISLQRGAINWIDPYLVRRDSGPLHSGVRFGLADPATQQAYLMQYNGQLQSIVAARQNSGLAANFAATDFFQSLPPVGPFPLDAISTKDFSQVFFPQQMDVRLSIIPSDELPALVEDGISLPPIDLTLAADAYTNLAVFALIPVPRNMLAALKSTLPDTPLNPTLPQVIANRTPLQLLRLFQGNVAVAQPAPVVNSAWATSIGQQKFGFYVRRRSEAIFVDFTSVGLTSSKNPAGFGQSVTFTATVRPGSATGSIQFNDGIHPLGAPVALSGATASITVPNASVSKLSVGAHPITAVYGGDGENSGSTSATLNEIVSNATVAVTSSLNPATLGLAVTFTATVSPNTASGNVQFRDGGVALGAPVALSGASATLTIPSGTLAGLTTGAHLITADYSGDASNAGSSSTPFPQTITQAATTTALSTSANPGTVGQGITFTATVTGSVAGIAPTGTVQFKDLAAVLGGVNVTAGKAVLVLSNLAVGSHSIAAVYSGDANYLSSTSQAIAEAINPITSGVIVSSNPNPSIFGGAVSLNATVTPATATGTVQFSDGATALGSPVTLAAGKAQLSLSTLAVGSHSITAAYSGDSSDAKSVSGPTTQVVNPIASAVTLSALPNPSPVNQPLTLTATVAPNTATGNVQFLDGTSNLGAAVPISSGAATLKISTLAVGAHSIKAAYAGDTNDAPANSNAVPVTITQIATTTTLASSANPSTVGQAVKFTATVAPASATGTVTFVDGSATLGTSSLSTGTASVSVSTLALGTHSITATYSGDTTNASSKSQALPQQVNVANSSIVLRSSLDPAQFGAAVTFTAAVTPATATGTVRFKDGGANLGAAVQVTGGQAQLPANNLTVGSHSITADYSGDPNNSASTSNTLPQSITQASTTSAVVSSAPSSPFGANVTFTATVTPASATGSMQFRDGTAVLGTPQISGGKATFATSALAAASHSISVVYSGDANFLTSTSPAITQTITPGPTTVTVKSSLNPSTAGAAVTLTATVQPGAATGTVQILDGTTSLGTPTIGGGSAAVTVSNLAVGTHSITAAYSGDASNAKSTSSPFPQSVSKAASSVQLTAQPTPGVFGQNVVFTVTVTPSTATGNVTLAEAAKAVGSPITLSGGTGATTTNSLTVGSHTVTATYSGDANLLGGSGSFTENIRKAPVTVTVTAKQEGGTGAAPSTTFTATIAPAAATGTVTFTASPDTPPLTSGAVTVAAGVATWTVVVPITLQTITAVYSGDANFQPATGTVQVGG